MGGESHQVRDKEEGPQGSSDAAVERRKARPSLEKSFEGGRLLDRAGIPGAPTALRSLKREGERPKTAPKRADQPKTGLSSRGHPRRER